VEKRWKTSRRAAIWGRAGKWLDLNDGGNTNKNKSRIRNGLFIDKDLLK